MQQESPGLLPGVRTTVRQLLLSSPAYTELDAIDRRRLAASLVDVCSTATALLEEERDSERALSETSGAQANSSRDHFRHAVRRVCPAGSHRPPPRSSTRMSFQRFVGELITGVFKAILDTNAQQLQQFIELLNNVATSTSAFTDSNYGPDPARGSGSSSGTPGSTRSRATRSTPSSTPTSRHRATGRSCCARVRLRHRRRRCVSISASSPRSRYRPATPVTLLPLVRRQLARSRQQMLATMIQMGLQRIVIDGGKISASMRFHIDTRSASQADTAAVRHESHDEGQRELRRRGWGASASMQSTIGYVSTQSTQSTEELNTELDLTSAVELLFRTDQVPLDRLASARQVNQVLANSRNPEAEAAIKAREAWTSAARRPELKRRTASGVPAAPTPSSPTAEPQTPPPGAAPKQPAGRSRGRRGAGGAGGQVGAGGAGGGRGAGAVVWWARCWRRRWSGWRRGCGWSARGGWWWWRRWWAGCWRRRWSRWRQRCGWSARGGWWWWWAGRRWKRWSDRCDQRS